MRYLAALLSLPASLLVLFASTGVGAQELGWPYNLPRTVKYFPEDEAHIKRDVELQQRLEQQEPVGVRKMSEDAGEKFFLHYWDLGEEPKELEFTNASMALPALSAPIAPHTKHDRTPPALFGRNVFARDFSCPADTTSCSSLGSDLCCASGQSCVSISSSVCCCPSGETCGGDSCGGCDTSQGYTSCPGSSDGGCCVPGAKCEGSGCVFYGTATTVVTLPTSTVVAGASYSTASDGDGTTTYAIPAVTATTTDVPNPSVSVSGYTTTVTVTQSLDGAVTTVISPTTIIASTSPLSTATATILTCTSGFQACPSSLGGGCCPNGQICGTSSLCLDQSTSTLIAPIRPTSVSTDTDSSVSAAAITQTTTTISATTSSNEACPTGFYMCSAYYMGGCCRVGRNCDTTSCPTTDSTAVVSSGATVVVPYTSTTVVGGSAISAASGTQGSCAGGWFSCGADVGGGCCPSGHICGTASCSATASGEQNTGKETPSTSPGNVLGWAWSFLLLAVGSGVGMMWL